MDANVKALVDSVLNAEQKQTVREVLAELVDRHCTLVDHVEAQRDRLTARDAEQRSAAVNELCALVLHMLSNSNNEKDSPKLAPEQLDQLLPFLLSKVEDCGHLSDLLITTLHQAVKLYDPRRPLSTACLDQAVRVLFETGGVPSFGQRDRLHLFALFDHLVSTHTDSLRSAVGAQRIVLAFVRSAQGEREPRVLLRAFTVHAKLAAAFNMGVLAEDMFELVACYFPIDYEPDENDDNADGKPQVTRAQLRHACECSLLAHPAFGPFCSQLCTEKLLETEEGSADASDAEGARIVLQRQLEICEFFIRVCERFTDPGLQTQMVEDLMSAFRLLFMNPAQNKADAALLARTADVVERTARALAQALERNAPEADLDPNSLRLVRLMAENTLENVEPFVLQAEMGTAGRAFRLLRCVALAHPALLAMVVPRALYWLHVLLEGKTLRSTENSAEIAAEALQEVPGWLRLCCTAGVDGCGVFGTSPTPDALLNSAVYPLLDAMRALQTQGSCTPDLLHAARCEALSVLLLAFFTRPADAIDAPRIDAPAAAHALLQNNYCTPLAESLMRCGTTAKDDASSSLGATIQRLDAAAWCKLGAPLKQFLALYARFCCADGKQLLPEPAPILLPRLQLELLPALVVPFDAELEGRHASTDAPAADTQQRAVTERLLAVLHERNDLDASACAALLELAQRLQQHNQQDELKQFTGRLVQFGQSMSSKNQWPTARLDTLAGLLQDVGALLHASHLQTLTPPLITHPRALRTFWLLHLLNKPGLNDLSNCIRDALFRGDADAEVDRRWLMDALVCTRSALYSERCVNDDDAAASPADDPTLLEQFSDEEERLLLRHRMRAAAVRCTLLTRSHAGDALLAKFFADFLVAPDDSNSDVLDDLLDVHRRPTCPERCNYRRTLFWRQRFFCQFVPPYVNCLNSSAGSCSSTKRRALLRLLGPLLKLAQSCTSMDPLMGELGQLLPIFVDAFADAEPDALLLLLDALRSLLERMPAQSFRRRADADDNNKDADVRLFVRLAHALCMRACPQSPPLVQARALQCLTLLPARASRDALAPLHACVLRATTALVGSPKRIIRTRAAMARNAWELALS